MEKSTVPTRAACRRSPVAPLGNNDEGEGDDGEEEEEQRMPASLSSLDSGSATKPSDASVDVKMAGVEIAQRRENNTTTTTASTSSSSSSSSRVADSAFSFNPVPPPLPPPSKSTATGSRSSEGREPGVHRVTFAEPWNSYVHSDSGIVLSPDDAAAPDNSGDVTAGHDRNNPSASSDDENGDVDDDDVGDDVRDRLRIRLAPVNANAVPGPPIIKLHRSKSTESRDNPFQFDGELRRKADYIISHSTFQRTYVRVADPDQISLETPVAADWSAEEPVSSPAIGPSSSLTMPGPTQAGEDDDGADSPSPPPPKPQRSVFRAEAEAEAATPPRQPQSATQSNGDMEEPLLASSAAKEGNGLGGSSSKRKLSKSKRRDVCCVVL